MSRPMKCERCGRLLKRVEGGAYIGAQRIYLCHPDDPSLPDCYSIWTRQHTSLPMRGSGPA